MISNSSFVKIKNMKIAIMGAWNTDSGASIHAELIGRSFVELGHKVSVLTFFKDSFHGTMVVGEDEDYVIRCFSVSSEESPQLLATPFLTSDYEFFVAEDHGMFPLGHLGKIFHWIKKKAKTIAVIHDGALKEDPDFYQFEWDAIVCFDERYYNFLKTAYPEKIIHIIPYPCFPWNPGNLEESRKALSLPLDKKIVFLFGPASEFGADKFDILTKINEEYPILVVVATKHRGSLQKWRMLKSKDARGIIEMREEGLSIEKLYQYLYASDLFLYNKPTKPGVVVVASTAFQCLGSGCPMVALESSFVEILGNSIYRYKNDGELKASIVSAFERDERYKKVIRNAEKYVKENTAMNIAKKFVELFKSLR